MILVGTGTEADMEEEDVCGCNGEGGEEVVIVVPITELMAVLSVSACLISSRPPQHRQRDGKRQQ